MSHKWDSPRAEHPHRADMAEASGKMYPPPGLLHATLEIALADLLDLEPGYELHSFEVRMPSRRDQRRNGRRHYLRVTLRETPEDEQ